MCQISTNLPNFIVVGFSGKNTCFLKNNRASKFLCSILHYLISITKLPKKSVNVSQCFINHPKHLNVWLVSDQGPLVLEFRILTLSYVEFWSGNKLFPHSFVFIWREFKGIKWYSHAISSQNLIFIFSPLFTIPVFSWSSKESNLKGI